MNVTPEDFNHAFDFMSSAISAVLQAQGPHDGFHVIAFALDSGPTLIAERGYGDQGKPGRKYRHLACLKAAETAERKMSIQELRLIEPERLERLRLHDGSVIDKTNGFGIACAGIGTTSNIAFAEIARKIALQSASQRVPETIAAE